MKKNTIFTLCLALTVTAPFGANAKDIPKEEAATVDFKDISCRDFLKFQGEQHDSIVTFVHGYINGKQDTTLIDIAALGTATDKAKDVCIDHPDKNIVEVFMSVR